MSNSTQLKTLLLESTRVAIFGHTGIDGDALGSCAALGIILRNLGKKTYYFTPKSPSKQFDFLDETKKFSTDFDYHDRYDLIVFLDTATPKLMDDMFVGHEEYFASKTTVAIDHHDKNDFRAQHNFVNASTSSACEYLCNMIRDIDETWITKKVATFLFLGLSTDTGHFMYDKNPEKAFETASFLISRGAEKQRIVNNIYRSQPLENVRFLGTLMQRMRTDGEVMSSWYGIAEVEEKGLDKEYVRANLGIITTIKHDGLVMFFKDYSHEPLPYLKCSLRTKNKNINVSDLAGLFGGGGHRMASGCKVMYGEQDFQTVMKSMIEQVNKDIENQRNKEGEK